MAIPEPQLVTWSHQGSIVQSSSTCATIRRALESTDTRYAGKSYETFLQGSYCNDTNIYAESDVDVVICLDSVYYYDITGLTAAEQTAFNAALVPGTYPYATYKADVVAALVKSFGTDVKPGNNAVKIKANGNRRSADVAVAAEFRRYYSALWVPQYERGICFFNDSGNRIANYPKHHSANCTEKHRDTNGWFKPMVRILKNMRSRLVDEGSIEEGSAPSYFIEGLLYNVPNDKFGVSYGDTFVAAINWIFQADRSTFVCANKLHYLVRDSVATCWAIEDCNKFLDALAALWNEWS